MQETEAIVPLNRFLLESSICHFRFQASRHVRLSLLLPSFLYILGLIDYLTNISSSIKNHSFMTLLTGHVEKNLLASSANVEEEEIVRETDKGKNE